MNDLQTILSRLDVFAAVSMAAVSVSPYLRGDKAAAIYCDLKSAKTFRKWADSARVKPSRADGVNTWSKADIQKAMDRFKA